MMKHLLFFFFLLCIILFSSSLFIFIFKTFFFSIQYQNKQFLKGRDSTNCLTTTGEKKYIIIMELQRFTTIRMNLSIFELICECCDRNGLLIDSNISFNKYRPNERRRNFNCWTVVHFHIIISILFSFAFEQFIWIFLHLIDICVCVFVSLFRVIGKKCSKGKKIQTETKKNWTNASF